MELKQYSQGEILSLFKAYGLDIQSGGNNILKEEDVEITGKSGSSSRPNNESLDILSDVKEIAKEEIINLIPSMYNLQMFDIDYRLGVDITTITKDMASNQLNIDENNNYILGNHYSLGLNNKKFSSFGNFPNPNQSQKMSDTTAYVRDDYLLRTPSFSSINRQINILQASLGKALGLPFVFMTEWDLSYYFTSEVRRTLSSDKYNMFYRLKEDNPKQYTDGRMLSEASVNCAADQSYQFATRIYDPTFASVCPTRYVTRTSPSKIPWPVDSMMLEESEYERYGASNAIVVPATGTTAPNGAWISPKKVKIPHYFGINQSHVNAVNKNPNPITKMLFYDMYRAKLSGWNDLFLKYYKHFYFSEGMTISDDRANLIKNTPFRLPEIGTSMAGIVANDGADGDIEEESGLDASDEARSANASLSMGSGLKGCIKGVKSAFKFLRAMNKMGLSFKRKIPGDFSNDNGSNGNGTTPAVTAGGSTPASKQASHNAEDYRAKDGKAEPYDTLSNGVNHFSPMAYGGPVGTISPTSIYSYTANLRMYRGNFTDDCLEHFELDDLDDSVNQYLKIENLEKWCGWYNSYDTHYYANNWCRGPREYDSINSKASVYNYPYWYHSYYDLQRVVRCSWWCWFHNRWQLVRVTYEVATSYGHFCANHPHFRYIYREYRYSDYVTLVGVDVVPHVKLKLTVSWNWRKFFSFGGGSPLEVRWKLTGSVSRRKQTLCALNANRYNGDGNIDKEAVDEKEPNSLINQLGRGFGAFGRVPYDTYRDDRHDRYCEFGMWFSCNDFMRLNSSMNHTLSTTAKSYSNLVIARPVYRNNGNNYSTLRKNKTAYRFLSIREWVNLVKYQLDNFSERLDIIEGTAKDMLNPELKEYLRVLYSIYVPTQVKLASEIENDNTQDGFNPFLTPVEQRRYNRLQEEEIETEIQNLRNYVGIWKDHLEKICVLWENAGSVQSTNYYANYAKSYFVNNIMKTLSMKAFKSVSAIMVPLNILYEARQYFIGYRFNKVDGTYYSMALLDSIKTDMLLACGLSNNTANDQAQKIETELGKLPIAFYDFNQNPSDIALAATRGETLPVSINTAYVKCEYVSENYYNAHKDEGKVIAVEREYKANSNSTDTVRLTAYIKRPEDGVYIIETEERQKELLDLKEAGEPLENATIKRIIKNIVWDGTLNTPIVFGRLSGLDLTAITDQQARMEDDPFTAICNASEISDYWKIDYASVIQEPEARLARGLETDAWLRKYESPKDAKLLLEISPIESETELI